MTTIRRDLPALATLLGILAFSLAFIRWAPNLRPAAVYAATLSAGALAAGVAVRVLARRVR